MGGRLVPRLLECLPLHCPPARDWPFPAARVEQDDHDGDVTDCLRDVPPRCSDRVGGDGANRDCRERGSEGDRESALQVVSLAQ